VVGFYARLVKLDQPVFQAGAQQHFVDALAVPYFEPNLEAKMTMGAAFEPTPIQREMAQAFGSIELDESGESELGRIVAAGIARVNAEPHRTAEAIISAQKLAKLLRASARVAPLDATQVHATLLAICPLFPFC